jgi:ribosomal protein S18 acetylase RimI-like enzyme
MKTPLPAHFRWMKQEDIPAVALLAQRIWNAHYPAIISQEQINYMLADRYSSQSLAEQMQSGQSFLLAEIAGEILGFLSIGALKDIRNTTLRGDDYGSGCYFLHKFYLAPECQGKGLGQAMLKELLHKLPEIRLLRLQVHRNNIQAWRFYQKQGFEIVAEEDFEIGDRFLMQDFVMQRYC